MDMQGTSAIGKLTMSDFDIHMSTGNFTRGQHYTGHFEGGHNNIGSTSTKTSPIYTIGSNYNPTDAALSNMYGIGFSHGNDASFISMGVQAVGDYMLRQMEMLVFFLMQLMGTSLQQENIMLVMEVRALQPLVSLTTPTRVCTAIQQIK